MVTKLFRTSRIGEFTPWGFILGFALCFSFFWIAYHRLSFGTVAPAPVAQNVSVHDLELLAAQIKSDEKSISDLQKKVGCLQLVVKERQKHKADAAGKCE